MGAAVLTTTATVQCPHGGQAMLTTANTVATGNGAVLLQTDQHGIAGCPFQVPVGVGTKPQPCVTLRWLTGAAQVRVNGIPVVLQTSAGMCSSIEGIPQGPPVVVQAAPGVTGI